MSVRNFDPRTTREVETTRNMVNRKPYRTKEQKAEAFATAAQIDGRYVSRFAPVSFNKKAKEQQ
jgi:hypothetical protein